MVVQHCPFRVSQTRHRPSKLDVTKRFPSASNATEQIRRECASRERTQVPLRTSHKRTTPSSAPVITRFPCGLKLIDRVGVSRIGGRHKFLASEDEEEDEEEADRAEDEEEESVDVIDRLIGRAVSLENRQPQRWFLAVWRGDTTANATWLPEADFDTPSERSTHARSFVELQVCARARRFVGNLAAPSTHAVCHFREVAAGAPTKHGRRCVDSS